MELTTIIIWLKNWGRPHTTHNQIKKKMEIKSIRIWLKIWGIDHTHPHTTQKKKMYTVYILQRLYMTSTVDEICRLN